MIYPVCTCVAQRQSYEEDQGDEKVARTDEKSQNQVVFCPLWVEGWRSRRVRVLRYPGDWHKGKLKSTYSGPEPQIIMSPELPSRNTRSTMRPNTWRCIFWCLHIPPRKLTNSKSFIMKFLDVRLPILKSIVKCLNIFALGWLSHQHSTLMWHVQQTQDTKPCAHNTREIRKAFTTLTKRGNSEAINIDSLNQMTEIFVLMLHRFFLHFQWNLHFIFCSSNIFRFDRNGQAEFSTLEKSMRLFLFCWLKRDN